MKKEKEEQHSDDNKEDGQDKEERHFQAPSILR